MQENAHLKDRNTLATIAEAKGTLPETVMSEHCEQSVITSPCTSKSMLKLFGHRPHQGYHWQSEISLLCCQDIVQPLTLNYTISEEEKKQTKRHDHL